MGFGSFSLYFFNFHNFLSRFYFLPSENRHGLILDEHPECVNSEDSSQGNHKQVKYCEQKYQVARPILIFEQPNSANDARN